MRNHVHSSVSGPESNVLDRITDCHRKTSTFGPVTHETHTVASQEQLVGARDTGKDHPIPKSLHPHLKWWLEESNVITGQPLHPLKHALQIFTDASKEGWGAHLNKHMAKGSWSLPESKLHINYLELKAVLLRLKEFQALCTNNIVLRATDNTTVVAYINKEGGNEVGPPMCPTVENTDLVHQDTGDSHSSTHSRPSEHDCRQAIQTGPDYSNRMVPQPRDLPSNMQPVAQAQSGPICYQVQQQASTVCLTSPRPPGMGSGCS